MQCLFHCTGWVRLVGHKAGIGTAGTPVFPAGAGVALTDPLAKERIAAFDMTPREIREKEEAVAKIFGSYPPIHE